MAAPYTPRASPASIVSSPWICRPLPRPQPKPYRNMRNHYDYKKFAVLYVDDEEKSLVNFTRAFGDDFKIFTANRAAARLRIRPGPRRRNRHPPDRPADARRKRRLVARTRPPDPPADHPHPRDRLRGHGCRHCRRQQRGHLQICVQALGSRASWNRPSSKPWSSSSCRRSATSCSAKKCPSCAT